MAIESVSDITYGGVSAFTGGAYAPLDNPVFSNTITLSNPVEWEEAKLVFKGFNDDVIGVIMSYSGEGWSDLSICLPDPNSPGNYRYALSTFIDAGRAKVTFDTRPSWQVFDTASGQWIGRVPWDSANLDISKYSIKGLSVFCAGKPASNEVISLVVAPYYMNLSSLNSSARASVAATASAVFNIKIDGAQAGTITFSAGATIGVVYFSAWSISADQLLSIQAPSTSDATLADIAILIKEAP